MNRRSFVKASGLAGISIFVPNLSEVFARNIKAKVSIGLITDLHQDIMHDAEKRLQQFVDEVNKKNPSAVVQMGDFAYPSPKNKSVIDLFNNCHSNSYHVLGNHDTDSGFTKEQCLKVWKMPKPYYTFDVEGIKAIVLDGNEKGSPTHKGGYPSYIGPDQLAWLKNELDSTNSPMIIISHQPLAGVIAVDNEIEIQNLLSNYKDRILLCINGHSHIDQHLHIKGINYLHINSASYYWVGGKYKHQSYSENIHESYPYISSTCPYKDSLFAFLTIDPEKKSVSIKGKKTKWMGKSPDNLGFQIDGSTGINQWIMPEIRNRKI